MTRVLMGLGALLAALVFTVAPDLGRHEPAEAIIVVCDQAALASVPGSWVGTAMDSVLGLESVTLQVTQTENRRFTIDATAVAGGMTLTAMADATLSNSCHLEAPRSDPFIKHFHVQASIIPGPEGSFVLTGTYDVTYADGSKSMGTLRLGHAGTGGT